VTDATDTAWDAERCTDQIGEFIATLEEYPEAVIAAALRQHLAALLQAMLAGRLWSSPEVSEFLLDLEREVFSLDGD
jgi:hypothetical protein